MVSMLDKKFLKGLSTVLALALSVLNSAAASTPEEPLVYRADVVVVGAGSAGLSAALEAANHHARVIILEKMPMIGGNSLQAAGYMLALPPETDPQRLAQAREELIRDMLKEGGSGANKEKITMIVDQSRNAVKWLQGMGAELKSSPDYVTTDYPVAYHPLAGTFTVGEELVKTLVHSVETHNIPMLTLTHVTSFTTDDEGQLTGVVAVKGDGRELQVRAPAVIVATGGFGASDQMVEKYVHLPYNMSSTNLPGTTGDGLVLSEKLGAKLVDMDQVMVHLTTLPFSGLVIPMQARTAGGILINEKGHRFANELSADLDPYYKRADGHAWLIMDQDIVDRFPVLRNYAVSGFMQKGRTEEELARLIRVNPETLSQEMERYRAFARRQQDADYHRPTMPSLLNHYPLYAISVRPGLQSTLGGLATDTTTRVLDKNDKPIAGLYAVGEVTGGLFGARRLEGSSLTASVVFGRIAGRNAAEYARRQKGLPASGASKKVSQSPVAESTIDPLSATHTPSAGKSAAAATSAHTTP